MIYTDPDQGTLNGYNYDGWDANDDSVFYYTGEGRHGDQEIREGNKAILNHEADGPCPEALRGTGRTAPSWRQATALPRRLLCRSRGSLPHGSRPRRSPTAPTGHRLPADQTRREPAVGTSRAAGIRTAGGNARSARQASDTEAQVDEDESVEYLAGDADVVLVPSEQNTITEFELQPRTGTIARRGEAKLVSSFEAHLRQQGHDLRRCRIKITGERHELVTDTYDVTDRKLYEAKSKSDRATVRLAIGQLLDYLRFIADVRGCLLLPDEPSEDVKLLIRSCGFGLVYRRLGSWIIEE